MTNLQAAANAARISLCTLVLLIGLPAFGQTLTVYDDALLNGFADYSYNTPPGSSDFASTAQVHSGTKSIAFTGNNYGAVAFAHPGGTFLTAQYPVLDFWIHGGTAGGQIIYLQMYNGGPVVGSTAITSYVTGGAGIVASAWREVTIPLTAALGYSGAFDRLDLQSESAGQQGTVYLDDVTLGQVAAQAVAPMAIAHDATVASMVSDQFTWTDSAGKLRVAVLAHNNNGAGPGGAQGGTLREFRYQLPNGATRIATVTTYGNSGYTGFGYVVAHAHNSACIGDDSPLGGFVAGQWQRVFEGRHHAIFRFTQDYPRNCAYSGGAVARTIPVVMDWIFSTGRDNPIYAITWNIDLATPAVSAGTLFDDSRAPYGELNIDGQGAADIDGVAWGDRYKFTSTSAPVTLSSSWTWNVPNTVPYVKEWIAGPLNGSNYLDATMGLVQTQTMTQQDAAGARDAFYHDVTPFWGHTSAEGNAGGAYSMPYQNEWPYQANADSIGVGISNNNARLTWRTQFGFIGQATYDPNDGVVGSAPGYPNKSYSTYVVLETNTAQPVEAQVTQVETIQNMTLTAATGSVVTTGPAGVTRVATVTYQPPGYNHVYGALAFGAAGNQLDANIALSAGTLKKPLIIISNFTSGSYPTLKLAGATLTADVDYFASLRGVASELWITLNRDLSGNTNHLEILSAGGSVPPAPTGVSASAITTTRIDVSWTAVGGAASYQVDRRAPADVFTQIGTPAGNSYSDTIAAPNTAYVYRVRAVNGSGPSANSAVDLATTIFFTNTPLTGVAVKALHLAELRAAVDAVRSLAATGAGGYTDAANAGLIIKAVHITQLRTALDTARAALTLPAAAYTDGALAGVPIKAVHFQELRNAVQ